MRSTCLKDIKGTLMLEFDNGYDSLYEHAEIYYLDPIEFLRANLVVVPKSVVLYVCDAILQYLCCVANGT